MAKKKTVKKKGSTRRKTATRKAREGNASRRVATRPNGEAIAPAVGAVKLTTPPPCPPSLKGRGAQLWEKLARQLVELKLLTELDLEALEVLCEAWRRYHDLAPYDTAEQMFVTTDKGYVVEHPALRMRQASVNTIAKLWRQFGLTPLTRESLDVDLSDEDDDDVLKFASRKPK